MKLIEIKKQLHIIPTGVRVPRDAMFLDYHNTIINGYFNCSNNPNITTLKGSPVKVRGPFGCSNTRIRTLAGCPKEVGEGFYCEQNPYLASLHNIHKYIKKIGGDLYISDTVRSNMLGILFIRDLKFVNIVGGANYKISKVLDIINKYIENQPNSMQRNIHKCQEEMIEAGLEEFAQL